MSFPERPDFMISWCCPYRKNFLQFVVTDRYWNPLFAKVYPHTRPDRSANENDLIVLSEAMAKARDVIHSEVVREGLQPQSVWVLLETNSSSHINYFELGQYTSSISRFVEAVLLGPLSDMPYVLSSQVTPEPFARGFDYNDMLPDRSEDNGEVVSALDAFSDLDHDDSTDLSTDDFTPGTLSDDDSTPADDSTPVDDSTDLSTDDFTPGTLSDDDSTDLSTDDSTPGTPSDDDSTLGTPSTTPAAPSVPPTLPKPLTGTSPLPKPKPGPGTPSLPKPPGAFPKLPKPPTGTPSLPKPTLPRSPKP